MALKGPSIMPASGEPPRQLVVFLHGYGADGNDLISIGELLAPHFPQAAFFSPNAPERCDISAAGRQWFRLTFRDPHELKDGTRRATPVLLNYLNGLISEHGLEPDALALVGFRRASCSPEEGVAGVGEGLGGRG